MATVDWDVRSEIERIINAEWSLSQDYDIIHDDDVRNQRVNGKPLFVLQERGNRQFEPDNLAQSVYDKGNQAYLHMIIPNDESISANDVWSEVMRCLLNNSKEIDGLQGNWDYITIDNIDMSSEVRESEFTMRVNFKAHSQSFDGSVGK